MLVLALAGGALTVGGQATADDTSSDATATAAAAAEPRDFGPAEADNENTARVLAQAENRRIEILAERTETSSAYANPDGSLTTEAFAAQIRVKQDGKWKDIDTTLSDTGADLTPETAVARIAVSDGGDTDLASVSDGGKTFGLGWQDTLPAPHVDGDTATPPRTHWVRARRSR
ncbi:hypothetical protein NHG22_14015 [Streptomyces sp. ATE26]|uniref:hypothetical protein n=1 Tax=Streptomyces sp. ATE26 TaxID=2954237 RepID=UPI0024831722|nr:hypothetical protein [Streptomyces sp. ATE26]MDI1454915.1 hypothetical protein [Streptomyces sp. ATE26]